MTPDPQPPRVLILGATGMLGHVMFSTLARDGRYDTRATIRGDAARSRLTSESRAAVIGNINADNADSLTRAFSLAQPNIVINCIGVIKHLAAAHDPLAVLPLNAMLPHRLAQLCQIRGARLIHISTDCVYDGARGDYHESDPPDARDLYGVSKALGEVTGENCVTLRTSILGPELGGTTSLLEWFLSRTGTVPGYARAIFSGLPTVELAEIIRDRVIPDPGLTGLYHVSAEPIDKCTLLGLIRDVYGLDVELRPENEIRINRSLNSDRFRAATGYRPPDWPELVARMHRHHQMLCQTI